LVHRGLYTETTQNLIELINIPPTACRKVLPDIDKNQLTLIRWIFFDTFGHREIVIY